MKTPVLVWNYWRSVLCEAFRTSHIPIVGLTISAIATVLQGALEIRAWDATVRVLWTLFLALGIVCTLIIAWHILAIPPEKARTADANAREQLVEYGKTLHEEFTSRYAEVYRLRDEVAKLSEKPYAMAKEQEVRKLLGKSPPAGIDIVKFLLPRGEVSHDAILRAVGGDKSGAFSVFRENGLVVERIERLHGGLGTTSFWKVPDEFKPVLEDVLYPRGTQ